jgi:hypothetical protein
MDHLVARQISTEQGVATPTFLTGSRTLLEIVRPPKDYRRTADGLFSFTASESSLGLDLWLFYALTAGARSPGAENPDTDLNRSVQKQEIGG